MKMIKIILILLSFSIVSCKAQIPKSNMEALYTKKITDAEFNMHFTTKNNVNYWTLNLTKKNEEEVKLDEFEKKTDTSNIFKQYSDIRKQIIVGDAIEIDNTIYVALYKEKKIHLLEYLINENKVSKKEYIIGNDYRGSFENFGDPSFVAEIKKMNSQLFIMAQYCGLVKFDLKLKEIKSIKFFNTVENPALTTTASINNPNKENTFNYNQKIIKTLQIDTELESLLVAYNKNSKIKIDSEKKQLFEGLRKTKEKGIYLFEIKNIEEENTFLRNSEGVTLHRIYEKLDKTTPDFNAKIKLSLESVFENYYKGGSTIFTLLSYMQEIGNEDVLCFFYSDPLDRIKIARYSYDNKQWLIGDYKEESIKIEK
jgi:hypothetical protein